MPKVSLLTYTENPEKLVAAAAKLCYSSSAADKLLEGLDEDKTEHFVQMLAEIGHESPIEHCSFTFSIAGVSRAFLAQMTRHRIASYSVQSQRYVEENEFGYVTPPEIAGSPQALALFEQAMDSALQSYKAIADILRSGHQRALMDAGAEEKEAVRKASKMAIEDARFVLPNACDTNMVVTMNARSLLNFFRHRCCNRAQWEIHAVADQMLRLTRGVAPTLFSWAGPPCLRGSCPEGKMTCGKISAVREYYTGLGNT